MREIKFRGIPLFGKELVYGSLIIDTNENGEKVYIIRRIESGKVSTFEVKEETVAQYTGLKDKNDIEIYEHMELDNQFEVSFNQGSYILTNISNGDIMTLHKYIKDKNGQVKITREYTKI